MQSQSQKRYKLQYEHKSKFDNKERGESDINGSNSNTEKEKKYVILDPSKEYSMISSERLKKEGIDINSSKLSFKPVYLTELERLKKDGIDENKLLYKIILNIEDGIDKKKLSTETIKTTRNKRFLVKLELNILIGKENIEKKISVFVSEESNEEFYLGNDFLSFNSFYLLKKTRDNTTKYILRQEVEIEDDAPDMKDDIPTIKEEDISENTSNEENTPPNNPVPNDTENKINRFINFVRNNLYFIPPNDNENKINRFINFVRNNLYFIPLTIANNPENNPPNNTENKINRFINFVRNNLYFISLIIVIFAIIFYMFQYQSLSSSTDVSIISSKRSDFDEFIKYAKELGYDVDSLELPSNEAIKRNIIDCNTLAIRIERSKAFNNTGPQLVTNLNEFSKNLEIARSSYRKMYGEGVWFFWNFEQSIKNILDYISNKSFVSSLISSSSSSMELSRSIQDTIEALKSFSSSVEKAHEATLTADSFRSGTHSQVIRAKEEVQKFIYNNDNPSYWIRFWRFIWSIFDNTKVNDLNVDNKIAKGTELFLETVDNDLGGITKILFDFKENLDKHISMLNKLQAYVESSLETHEWNEYEIKRINELFNTIKENHKNFKSKNQT